MMSVAYPGDPMLNLSEFNNLTVRQFLEEMNNRLGGGNGVYTTALYSFDSIAFVTEQLTRAFEGGQPSLFAQDHLRFPGDFNLDRAVDAADYVVWRKTDGTPAGYNEWRTNFGWTAATGGGGISSVPEPATLLSLAIVACLIGVLWRSKK